MDIKLILIITFILTITYGLYRKYYSDHLSYEDKEDLLISLQYFEDTPLEKINDYELIIKTLDNIVYMKDDIVKVFIRGTYTIENMLIDLKCYLGINEIKHHDLYISSKKLIEQYKNKKIYLIGHSLGTTIANNIADDHKDYNIIKLNLFNPYFAFGKESFSNKNIYAVENDFDVVPLLTSIIKFIPSKDIKHIFKTIPTNTTEFFLLHHIPFFYSIYNDNIIFILDSLILVVLIILLYFYYN